MSIIVLSLLLLILVGLGGLMSKQVAATAEYFDNPTPLVAEVAVVEMSPALANLLNTPAQVAAAAAKPPPQVDVLARDRDAVAAANKAKKSDADDSDDDERPRKRSKKQKCPKCPKCPDMSQYVRLDEVPCWNCTLP
jgi:hypothetical protein